MFQKGHPLDGSGPLSHYRDASILHLRNAYSYWLAWVMRVETGHIAIDQAKKEHDEGSSGPRHFGASEEPDTEGQEHQRDYEQEAAFPVDLDPSPHVGLHHSQERKGYRGRGEL